MSLVHPEYPDSPWYIATATATSFLHKAKSGVTGDWVEWVPLKLLEHLPQTPVVTNIKYQLMWFWKKNGEASVHSAQQQLSLWHNSQNSSTPWHGEWLCYVAFVNQLKSSISYKKMCLDNILLLWGAPDCCHERILTIHIQHIYKLQTYNFQWPVIVHKKHCLVPVAVKCKRKRLWCKLKSTATFCSRATQSKLRSSARRKILLSSRRTQAWAEEPLPSRQKGRKWSNSFWQIAKSHWRTMSMYWLASSPLI